MDHLAQEEPYSIHQKQEDSIDQEHWTAGTLAQHGTITEEYIFKFRQLLDTEHPLNTSCTPTHVQIPRETPMDRAVKIAETLTIAIQHILKEPTINTGRHVQALEQLAKIIDNATDNLET